MIYIISGASRAGKSTVAKKLMKENNIPYIPLDSIMMGFMNGVPSMGIHDKLWPNEIAEKMWGFLKAMCENMIYNNIDYIFEGEAVLPQYINELMAQYPNKVKACFIGFSNIDTDEKVSNVKRYPNGSNDWLVNNKDEYIFEHIENMKFYSEELKRKCEVFNVKYFDTSINFEETINEVINYLIN